MQYIKLGNSDLSISRLGFGCWAMGGHGWGDVNDQNSIAAVKKAVALGINFFDTADVYGFGHSEEVLSRALARQRHEVIIATKFGVSWDEQGNIGRNCRPAYIRQALEASLRRLRLECIPLYQIHWPDPLTPLEDTIGELRLLQQEGKIRYFGCSNFQSTQISTACNYGPAVSLQAPYSLIKREIENEVMETCQKENLGILTYGSLSQGLLSGKYSAQSNFSTSDKRSRNEEFQGPKLSNNLRLVASLDGIGRKYGKSPAQTALRWVLDNKAVSCALVGLKTAAQVEENAGAMHWRLSLDDWQMLSRDTWGCSEYDNA